MNTYSKLSPRLFGEGVLEMKLFFILSLVIYLIGGFLPAEAGIVSPGQTRTISEAEKPTEWLDRNGHNKAWWMNQIAAWKEKRERAHEALLQVEKAFKMSRFKNHSAVQKRIERKQLREEIQVHTEELREAEAMLHTTLPEQARRAGVPSGWFR